MFAEENESKTTFDSPSASVASHDSYLGAKIIDKINEGIRKKKSLYSFEYFPPKTDAGVQNLYSRIQRMSGDYAPSFIDVTWGAGGSTAEQTLDIVNVAQNQCNAETMMHLTCTNMHVSQIKEALHKARAYGIRNILALRGDPPHGVEIWEAAEGGLKYAVDLVRLIREEHGDYFGIAVAGYPEAHLQADSLDKDIEYLKEKIDAGADFVITQLFYDNSKFIEYVNKCRAIGITAPIIPGILPIQSYAGFHRMIGFCKTYVPEYIYADLELIKDDDAAVKSYGVELAVKMSQELLEFGVPCLHFYTLNLEHSSQMILEKLGFIGSETVGKMPWKKSAVVSRACKESVRPVFWANRPSSFEVRTRAWNWDEFSNGRWGDSASPAFGNQNNYHQCSFKAGSAADRSNIWGAELHSMQDVQKVFATYLSGDIDRLPWCEGKLSHETDELRTKLIELNHQGFLTINSQPRVNGVPSTDAVHGWGGPGGYLYQKAYVEFFVNPEMFDKLISHMDQYESLRYMAENSKGERKGNYNNNCTDVTTVTWGVFNCREVIQPTVIDNVAFGVWREEAYALWISQWKAIYHEASESAKMIQNIHDTYWLVTVVDNNFIDGNIFDIFNKIVQ